MSYWKRYLLVFIPACLVLYPISFGPALWLIRKNVLAKRSLDAVYRPFLSPGIPRRLILPYARLWWPYGIPFASWKSPYTEGEVSDFLKPGTSRESILKRFGQPLSVDRNPVFEGGGNPVDEILYYDFYMGRGGGTYGEAVFSGFQARLKDGKLVEWSPSSLEGGGPTE